MKRGGIYVDRTPGLSYFALATLCFTTLILCHTRFKVTKEMSREVHPPVLRSKDYWFLYSIGNPDRFKCVLKAFVVVSSPILSLVSTGLVLLGKIESNPYFFLPWLFLTMKGLLLVQTDNLITILRDMATRANYAFGFRQEDVKWLLFYFTIFFIDLLEAFSFYEVFELFMVLWNHHPGFNSEPDNNRNGGYKKEVVDLMETISKCSIDSFSKMSIASNSESDDMIDLEVEDIKNIMKYVTKSDKSVCDPNPSVTCLSQEEPTKQQISIYETLKKYEVDNEYDTKKPNELLNLIDEIPTSDSSELQNEKKIE